MVHSILPTGRLMMAVIATLLTLVTITTATHGDLAQAAQPPETIDEDGPTVFFGPVPPRPASLPKWPTPDGSSDYMALFAPGAEWATAAAKVDYFLIHSWMVRHYLTDAELLTISRRLDDLGIKLAIEAEPLTPPDPERCDHSESYEGPYELENLRRLDDLRIEVALIAVEQPFSFGHLLQDDRACKYEVDHVAAEVAEWANDARRIYPGVPIGSVEGLSTKYGTSPDNLQIWLNAFEMAFGEPFAFLHLDVDWRWEVWPALAIDIGQMAASNDIPFGIIYNGEPTTGSVTSEEWLQSAAKRMAIYETNFFGSPDNVIIQSWTERPERPARQPVPP